MDKAEVQQLMRNRRSVYPNMFTECREIPRETLLEILENANWAPNHRKTEPWRFHIFTGGSRQSLSEYLGQYYLQHTPTEKQSSAKHKRTMQKPLQSSAAIAICMKRDPAERLPEWEEIAAVAMGVQNLWLSLSAHGLAGYWSSPKAMRDAAGFLGLAEGEQCLGVFYLGYHEGPLPQAEREAITDKITWR